MHIIPSRIFSVYGYPINYHEYAIPVYSRLHKMDESDNGWFKSEQDGRHFAEDILKCIFTKEKFEFSPKFTWNLLLMV